VTTPVLLVVDDDPELRELTATYLGQQGFTVHTVGDGQEMDEALQTLTPDLLVLDLMLPGEDGLSIAKRLKADRDLPIVILSAQGEDIDRIVGLEVGADDYLANPCPWVLRKRVASTASEPTSLTSKPTAYPVKGKRCPSPAENLICWWYWPSIPIGCSIGISSWIC
jgi:DNA-binding response OmpR family regulator